MEGPFCGRTSLMCSVGVKPQRFARSLMGFTLILNQANSNRLCRFASVRTAFVASY